MRRSFIAIAFLLVAPLGALAIATLIRRHGQHAEKPTEEATKDDQSEVFETVPAPVEDDPKPAESQTEASNEQATLPVDKVTDEDEGLSELEDVEELDVEEEPEEVSPQAEASLELATSPEEESTAIEETDPMDFLGDFATIAEDLGLEVIDVEVRHGHGTDDEDKTKRELKEIPFTWKNFERRLLMSIRPLDILTDEIEGIKSRMHEKRACDVERFIERMVRDSGIL